MKDGSRTIRISQEGELVFTFDYSLILEANIEELQEQLILLAIVWLGARATAELEEDEEDFVVISNKRGEC